MPRKTFTDARSPQGRSSDHFGSRLRARREGFELSVSDLSASTHIREDYIHAIERLDEAALPAIGYTLGFVRTYAQALGMDGDVAVKDYKADVAMSRVPLRDAPHVILTRQLRLPRGFVSALSVVGAALMIGVWYGTQSVAIANPTTSTVLPQFADLQPAEPIMAEGLFTLRATAPSWIRVSDASGTAIISRIFRTDETWQGPVDGGYIVSVRDAGAIELYDGAELLGTLGDRGQPLDNLILSADFPHTEDSQAAALTSSTIQTQ